MLARTTYQQQISSFTPTLVSSYRSLGGRNIDVWCGQQLAKLPMVVVAAV